MQRYHLSVLFNSVKIIIKIIIVGGSLVDCLDHSLDPETVLKIFYQATQAVKHMHTQSVPITHRDIKVNCI